MALASALQQVEAIGRNENSVRAAVNGPAPQSGTHRGRKLKGPSLAGSDRPLQPDLITIVSGLRKRGIGLTSLHQACTGHQ